MSASTEVVIVGGGLIGLACAWRAAAAGLDVTVCDATPGGGASWAAAGMLAPVTEANYGEHALLQLNLAAAAAYPSFVREVEADADHPVGYRQTGTLVVARDRDDAAALDELAAYQARLGLSSERLRSREARRLEPALAPGTRGGLLVPGDHQVDNRALWTALRMAAQRHGAALRRTRVDRLRLRSGQVAGVDLEGGHRLDAERVVLAAGWTSGRLEGVPETARIPLRPVKGQLLHLRLRPGMPPLAARTVRGLEAYLVPRADGRIIVGATMEERADDHVVTARAVHDLLRDAVELVPDVAECEVTETVAGLRPATPDNAPVIGATEVDGLLLAAGHYRNGVLLAPVTAEAIAALLTGTPPAISIADFRPSRFNASQDASMATVPT